MSITSLANVKHMSFDFWNTLAVPNLEFSAARSRVIGDYYDIPVEEAKRIYTSVKKFADTAAELTGFGTTRDNVMKLLNAQMPKAKQLSQDDLDLMAGTFDDLFVAFPPTVPAELVEAMDELAARGITMNILSNTNFIEGQTLSEVVVHPAFGPKFFAYEMYSNDWNCAKPSEDFFNGMLRNALCPKEGILRANIVHVGDNDITDIHGASVVDIKSLKVTSPHDLAVKLKELLNEPV